MEALACAICMERYDMNDCRPKTLLCGHSLCLSCLVKWLDKLGRVECPTCQTISYEPLEKIPDNQSIKDILMSLEVRCPRHTSVKLSAYCMGHMEVICTECGHTGTEAGCTPKDMTEDGQEINIMILQEIERRSRDLSEAMNRVVQQAIDKRFKNKLGENIQLLEKIKELEKKAQVLRCTKCQNDADNFIEIATFEAYCTGCSSYDPNDTNSVQIGGRSDEEIVQLLASKIPVLLKKVNFCNLDLNLLNRIEKRASLNPKEAQQLGKDLLGLEAPKPDFSALPDTFICPGCKVLQHKSTCMMFILPCSKLHALCETCAFQAGTISMTCPLDSQTYKRKPEELPRLAAPVSPQKGMMSSGYSPAGPGGADQQILPELRGLNMGVPSIMRPQGGMQPMMQQHQPPVMQQYPPQGLYPGPAMPVPGGVVGPPVFGYPQARFPGQPASPPPQFGYQGGFKAGPVAPPVYQPVVPRPAPAASPIYPINPQPATPSNPIAGLEIPKPQIDRSLQCLFRFNTVLPVPGPAVTNNKGWFYNFAKNQVEAVTMTLFDPCRLVAVGIANPISPDHMAIVESVSLYSGKTATGNPIAVHQGNEQLQGGNQLLTYVTLRTPFNIPAFSPATLKIKLVAPAANPPITGFELYRGNPFNRPDSWIGTDDLVWDFEETSRMGEGEMANGQNNLSGPILTFLYQH